MHTDVWVQRAIASFFFFFIFETWLYILMLSYPKIFQSSLQVMLFLLKKKYLYITQWTGNENTQIYQVEIGVLI